MNTHEIDLLCTKLDRNVPHEDIDRLIDRLSSGDSYLLAEKLLGNFFEYDYAIVSLLTRLFDDTQDYAELFVRFLTRTSGGLELGELYVPLKEKTMENTVKSLSLVKLISHLGFSGANYSGLILSYIIGKSTEAREFVRNGLYSRSFSAQRCCLLALRAVVCASLTIETGRYLELLKQTARHILQENTDLLISSLQCAFEKDPNNFKSVLESEVVRRGAEGACSYVFNALHSGNLMTSLMQRAVEILESYNPEHPMVTLGLGRIYRENPDFVIERLDTRLRNRNWNIFFDDNFICSIRKSDISRILQLIEKHINDGTPIIRVRGLDILSRLFANIEDWISWCEKWNSDPRKERLVVGSLIEILKRTGRRSGEASNRAISLARRFATAKKICYDKETKHVVPNKFEDSTKIPEGNLKAIHVLNIILYPAVPIDVNSLSGNLGKAPHLSKAIDCNWLISNASSEEPHHLAYIFHEKSFGSSGLSRAQSYWESIFKLLEDHRITIPKRKLHQVTNAKDVLAEAEVLSRLAPFFRIKPEPSIEALKPSKLDALIEHDGQRALIEVMSVHEGLELSVAHEESRIPGARIKNKLLDKFRKQLKEGKVNPGIPVLIIVFLEPPVEISEVEDAVYGEYVFSYGIRNHTGEIVDGTSGRKPNGFYAEPGTSVVTAVLAYKRNCERKDPLMGRIFHPPMIPLNAMTQVLWQRVRNAVFGSSETSNTRS